MTDLTPDGPFDGSFAGRTALATGASRGIGYGVARDLLARGASVVITGRKQPSLDDAAAALGVPERVLAVAGNAGDPSHRAAAVDLAVQRFGSLDVLVKNAGINPQYGPLVEADLEAVRRTFDVNVVAVLGWVQQAYRAWMGAHGGTVAAGAYRQSRDG